MSIFVYDNYDRPFAGFGAFPANEKYGPPPPTSQQGGVSAWLGRHWPVVLEVLAYIFLSGAAIGKARRQVEATVPKGAIQRDDFEWMVQKAMQLDPTITRAEAEKKICEAFGDRIPACYGKVKSSPEGLPSWLTYAGLGLVGFMLLK